MGDKLGRGGLEEVIGEVDVTALLVGSGVEFEEGINGDGDGRVALGDMGGKILKEQEGGAGRVGARIDGDGMSLQGSKEIGGEMGDGDIGHPECIGEKLGEDEGGRLGLDETESPIPEQSSPIRSLSPIGRGVR
jgi:hypothetical protein